MKRLLFVFALAVLCGFSSVAASAQTGSGLLKADDLKKVVPSVYFFRGQSASVQLRNSAGFSVSGKLVLAGLVDTGGYSTDVQAKYQGFLITEVKLNVGGSDLPPGQYGFGFSKEGKFNVMDVGSNDLFSVDAHADQDLKHPVPLTIKAEGDTYRLYSGRHWVELKAE
jgi:hypothetical protein